MARCAECGGPVAPSDPRPSVRSDDTFYHLSCAPKSLVLAVAEEYRAILRKGVRYFVEKYGVTPPGTTDPGTSFVGLGRAVEGELQRREGTPSSGDS